MTELKIDCNGHTHTFQLPENFSEMNREQFIAAVQYRMDKLSDKPTGNAFFTDVAGITQKLVEQLPIYHKYTIEKLFEFITEKDLDIAFYQQKFFTLKIGKIEYYGYHDNFGNTTWEEFVWADQAFINNDYKTLVAILYRQQRKNYDGETDIRIPFTNYGIMKRLPNVNKLDDATLFALALQYKAMRCASLENKYTQIFPAKMEFDNEEETPDHGTDQPENFSWVRIHRNLLGDNIVQEKEYLQLNVHTVLHRLNEVINESKKRKTA